MYKYEPKIIGVGLEKTGLTSLTKALSALGIVSSHTPYEAEFIYLRDSTAGRKLFYAYPDVIAFIDYPFPRIYQRMDKDYPGSKFILTVRDEDEWLKSGQNYFTKPRAYITKKTMEQWQDTEENNKSNLERYRNHIKEVKAYFKDRPNDLLEINICAGEGWEMLCAFLNKDVPDSPFPHLNKGD